MASDDRRSATMAASSLQCSGRDFVCAVQGYAVRFLKNNTSLVPLGLAEAPATPDRVSDLGILSWKDHLTEENLFYVVPPGAMETYRNSIESHLAKVEKTGSCIQEEVETSMYDAAAGIALTFMVVHMKRMKVKQALIICLEALKVCNWLPDDDLKEKYLHSVKVVEKAVLRAVIFPCLSILLI
ncbi:chromatin modification-related protein EAF1 A-like isoform X3 [Camellia sinensis]|uniref:chromatin modification-related protein EAF1 A-like isoform X3 n=1 Tax=Camellia sinensis TaxID=4442 RepID=UPI0010360EAD|nr:chromatin modification-related protein EAF1 A-like isoform X3 [Camellia sinensis]